MLNMKRLIVIGIIFLVSMLCWYIYEKGVIFALFPISIPAYLFLLCGGEAKFIIFPLFLYVVCLVALFAWLEKLPNKRWLIISVVGILVVMHLIAFQFSVRAFRQLGAGVVEQMLRRK